jgi:hypothetical protein
MSKKMAGVLIGYGIGMAGLGFLAHSLAPTLGRGAFSAGGVCGGLSVLWGLVALAGWKRRVGAVLTTVAAAFVMLVQAGTAFTATVEAGTGNPAVRWAVGAMFLLTVGMVAYLLHGERSEEFYQAGFRRPEPPPANPKNGKAADPHSCR